MSNQSQPEQQIKLALRKLSKVRKLFLLVELWLQVRVYKFLHTRPRARVHWLGSQRQHRPERIFILLTFLEAAVILDPYEFALWSLICGSIVSALVFVKSVSMVFQNAR